MPKYSTGGGGGTSNGETCELCGAPAETLSEAIIAGARLSVCTDCTSHDEQRSMRKDEGERTANNSVSQTNRTFRSGQGIRSDSRQGTSPLWDSDTNHWEEGGINYDSDQLPYLVSDYGDRVQTARERQGLTREEVAEETDIATQDLLLIEQGKASTSTIGDTAINALEAYFDVTLTE